MGSQSAGVFLPRWYGRRIRRSRYVHSRSRLHRNQMGALAVTGVSGPSDGFQVVKLKLPRHLSDDVLWYWLNVLHICTDQRVLAEQVYDARDPLGIKIHGVHGLGRKDSIAVGTGDMQARLNVIVSLLEGKSGGFASNRNSLLDLTQLRPFESLFKLRLADEHDL